MSALARRRARREERALALRLDAALSDPNAPADGLTRELEIASALQRPFAVFSEPPRTALVTLRAGLGAGRPRGRLVQRRPAWFVVAATAAAAIYGGITMAGGPGGPSRPRVVAADASLGVVSRRIEALQQALDANDPSRLQTAIVQAQATADQVINQVQAIPDQSSRQDTVQRVQDLQWLVNTAKVKLAATQETKTQETQPLQTTTSQPSSARDYSAGTASPPPPSTTSTSTSQPEATTTVSRPPRKGTTTTESPSTTAPPTPTTATPPTTDGGSTTTVSPAG